tara:strand:- start:271 stop:1215 length:945 start_codon:yes stop_codon:yes gene_type:complete
MFGLASPKKLREKGIIGMNLRNVNYIAHNNPRRLYPNVDDKYRTKLLCAEHDIAVPKLLGACRTQGHVNELEDFFKDKQQFVIKPAKGSGGKGILVIVGRDGADYLKPSGAKVTHEELCRHTSNILSGLFSLGGKPDIALIEGLVQFTDDFEGFSYEGVPDVRVIVYRGFPVMAMTRLSTRESDGKANLHQGAVGVGIDIATGRALRAVQHDRPIELHPDTGKRLIDLHVPHWQQLLLLSARGFEVSDMGYLGVDIVLDRQHGPLLLELNARPGLAIQVANGIGLRPRLEFVETCQSGLSAQERVAMAIEQFSE